jgi:hypothetical protein
MIEKHRNGTLIVVATESMVSSASVHDVVTYVTPPVMMQSTNLHSRCSTSIKDIETLFALLGRI